MVTKPSALRLTVWLKEIPLVMCIIVFLYFQIWWAIVVAAFAILTWPPIEFIKVPLFWSGAREDPDTWQYKLKAGLFYVTGAAHTVTYLTALVLLGRWIIGL